MILLPHFILASFFKLTLKGSLTSKFLGRFEIKSDDGLKIPINYHRSNSMRSGTSDDAILMPILEQDEKEQDDINYLSQV